MCGRHSGAVRRSLVQSPDLRSLCIEFACSNPCWHGLQWRRSTQKSQGDLVPGYQSSKKKGLWAKMAKTRSLCRHQGLYMWQGIKAFTDYQTALLVLLSPTCWTPFMDALTLKTICLQKIPTSSSGQMICLTTAEARRSFSRGSPHKAAEPGNIPEQAIKDTHS